MKVTNSDIIKFNDLYLQYKIYAEVARQTGFSPSTVKKYIIKDYKPSTNNNIIKFTGSLPEINMGLFSMEYFDSLCIYTKEEKEKIIDFLNEIQI